MARAKIFHKILKISAFLIAGFIIFILVGILIGKSWAPLEIIQIPFRSQPNKISDQGFIKSDNLLTKINIQKLTEVDWATTFDKALKDKTSYPVVSQKTREKTHSTSNVTVSRVSSPDESTTDSKSQIFLQYLVRSNLRLDSSQNPLEQAIHYRDSNQLEKISQLIQGIDQDVAQLESITPPEEAIGYHLVRLRLLREIRAVVEEIQFSPKGEALEDIVSKDEFAYLEQLSLILKKYLTYFFYPKVRA